jgi:magnesium transporter
MPRLYRKAKPIALPPGSIEHFGDHQQCTIQLMDYSEHRFEHRELERIEECFPYRDQDSITWINVNGLNVDVIQAIDDYFGIHPLVLEDIVNRGQRPKVEDYGSYLFFVIKMIYFDQESKDLVAEQVSIIVGQNYLFSFQEKSGDVFDPVRERIINGKGRIRRMGADYLGYALLDAIVDHYFVVLERMGETIDHLEQDIINEKQVNVSVLVHQLKRQLIYLNKQVWPLREVLSMVERMDFAIFQKDTLVFVHDLYDHTIQVNDTLSAFREALAGLQDIHLSLVSNRMNEVMKVLTIFAAIFIPLTFIAGIYGMNFQYIPELNFKYGYFVVITLMALIGGGMVIFFRKKGWL